MNQYLNCLYKQYCEAKGIVLKNASYELTYEFLEWIANNKLLLQEYADYLSYLGFYYDESNTAEIGKGRYDSLATEQMTVVSEYGFTQGKDSRNLFIQEGIPYVITKNNVAILTQQTILTHNPYSKEEIANWFMIHNLGFQNISIGMFGNITDENAKQKIKTIAELSKKMTDDYTFDFDTDKDAFFCSLNSKRHIKKKVLTR